MSNCKKNSTHKRRINLYYRIITVSDKPVGTPQEVHVDVRSYSCFYKNCQLPKDPNTIPPATERPANYDKWSEISTWKNAETGWGGSDGKLPKNGDKVKIQPGIICFLLIKTFDDGNIRSNRVLNILLDIFKTKE